MEQTSDVITVGQVLGLAVTLGGTILGLAGGLLLYMLKKRDDRIDENDKEIDALEKRVNEGEKKVLEDKLQAAKEYATKDNVRMLFQESQQANRDMGQRLEKQIDETKKEVKDTQTKIESQINDTKNKIEAMQTAVLTELAKKT